MAGLAVPVPYQWQVGDVATAALLDAQLYNGLTFLLNPPVFQGYQATTQSLASGTPTTLALDNGAYDPYSGHSNTVSNSRYTPQVPGWYLVIGTYATSGGNATGNRFAVINKNGTQIPMGINVGGAPAAANGAAVQVIGLVQCNGSTDYIEIAGYQSSGGAMGTSTTNTGMVVIFVHA